MVPSAEASSTTMTSNCPGSRVWLTKASNNLSQRAERPQVGITTATAGCENVISGEPESSAYIPYVNSARGSASATGLPSVRVGIVSWNTADLLRDCLQALPGALGSIDAEVVVVDNASSDASVEVAEDQHVRVIRNESNVGYARAMNQALTGSTADVLIALNPDTRPEPNSLESLVYRLLAGPPDVGLVVPVLLNPDGTTQHSVRRFPTIRLYAVVWFVPFFLHRGRLARRFWLEGRAPHDLACDIDWAIGAVHVIRSSALSGRDPYDERWFMYVEDLDFCWQLAGTGWRRRLEPSARVLHVGNAAGSQAWGRGRFRRYMEPSYEWYARQHGPRTMRAFAALNVVGTAWWVTRYIFVNLLRRRRDQVRHAVRQFVDEVPVHARAVLFVPQADAGPPTVEHEEGRSWLESSS